MIEKSNITIVGDGEQRRDFTHVDDIVDGLIRIMKQQAYGHIFEFGRGMNHSINEVAKMFNIKPIYKADKPGEAFATLADRTEARLHLEWDAKINLEDYIKLKIGIVGRGFVGSAVEFGFSAQTGCDAKVRVYDKDPLKSIHTLEETINKSDFIFLSVPTPSNPDGSMHLGVLESALQEIQAVNKRKNNIILIRSTVIPGTTDKLLKKLLDFQSI